MTLIENNYFKISFFKMDSIFNQSLLKSRETSKSNQTINPENLKCTICLSKRNKTYKLDTESVLRHFYTTNTSD